MKTIDTSKYLEAISLSDVVNFYFDLGQIHMSTIIENASGNKIEALKSFERGKSLIINFAYETEFTGSKWNSQKFLEQYPAYAYLVYRGAKNARYDKYLKVKMIQMT